MAAGPVRTWREKDDRLLRIRLARPKANVLDAAMTAGLDEGKAILKRGTVDLSLLDQKVEALCAKLLLTFPDCTTKTVQEIRKIKLERWNASKETSRDWLGLNMMTEARTGFRAFNEGTKEDREADFVALRQALARGTPWSPELVESLLPAAKHRGGR